MAFKKTIKVVLSANMPSWRASLALSHDACVALLAWVVAYLLRFNFAIPAEFIPSLWHTALWATPLQALIFISFGLYRGVWRFASIPDLQRILMAVLAASLAVTTLLFMFKPVGAIPRSVLILDPILLVLMMGGSRFAYRAWKEHKLYGITQTQGKPVLVLGAGDAAVALLKDLARSEEWRVIGLLDDDQAIRGRELLGVKVLGDISQLSELADTFGVRHAIIAMPSAAHQTRRRAVEIANQSGLTVLTVPAFDDLISGKVSVSQIRRVEVEDLLGREPVKLDDEGLRGLIDGRAVMVSGAGGSIGSELCRQIAKYQPSLLVCLELSELALYQLEQEFAHHSPQTKIAYVMGDVKNEKRLKALLKRYQPVIVFHAAAYKHVPLMENENVAEALANNVIGTYTLAKVCKEAEVEKFVLVSTDKAVNPTNVMGASKRLAEMVCQGLQEGDPNKTKGTRFVIVRFGNVLGSSGSVIPKFREQISKGGPVTVTHPDITRYFMSIPEAAQLVIQAGLMGTGAEIFVLDMGEPVRIADLAKDMIRLSGLQEDEIEVTFTGLRPGEKLYEELLADDELTLPTPHEKLRIAVARPADKAWVKALLKWIEASSILDENVIKRELKMWVEEYTGDTDQTKSGKPLAPRPQLSTEKSGKLNKITKAVFPVAGLGTRFLPATKASPKEMLPVVDKPLIQYAVEEAIVAGATDLIFITGRNKRSIADHFDKAYELEAELEAHGKTAILESIQGILPKGVSCVYIRQPEALGLGHAVLCAKPVVGDQSFCVILADDLIDATPPALKQMVELFDQNSCSILGVEDVLPNETANYGIVDAKTISADVLELNGIVEKPLPADAPSTLAVVGRYILTPKIFDCLENIKPGKGGEIQLTDGIAALLKFEKVLAYRFKGKRYDCGSKLGYMKANIEHAMRHPEIGDEFLAYLRTIKF